MKYIIIAQCNGSLVFRKISERRNIICVEKIVPRKNDAAIFEIGFKKGKILFVSIVPKKKLERKKIPPIKAIVDIIA